MQPEVSASAPAQDGRRIYRVSELGRWIKSTLEGEIGEVWVEGEISNFLHHASGHMYFALKDADAVINGAMFRGAQRGLRVKPENGMLVRAFGRITAYPARSQFQIVVERMEPAGQGSLQEAFEKLKAKLAAEGLFDAERKKPLPLLPRAIGIVTSPTGAAIRDILNILGRRFPNLHVLIDPVRVQGEGAAAEIAAAIDRFNARQDVDVLIVGRGGGSIEDLWAFNEEVVARAVARSTLPVISAVGHETDFTICDFVADVRAPTPSAAAELVVQPKAAFEESIAAQRRRMIAALDGILLRFRNRFTRAAHSYVFREPAHALDRHRDRVASCADRMRREAESDLRERQRRVDDASQRLGLRSEVALDRARTAVQRLRAQLDALSPHAVLRRGFSVTLDARGRAVSGVAAVAAGDVLRTLLADGAIVSTVNRTEKENRHGEGEG